MLSCIDFIVKLKIFIKYDVQLGLNIKLPILIKLCDAIFN